MDIVDESKNSQLSRCYTAIQRLQVEDRIQVRIDPQIESEQVKYRRLSFIFRSQTNLAIQNREYSEIR